LLVLDFNKIMNLIKKIFFLYYDGFRSMKLGRQLWLIIFIKLFIMFFVFRLFFFPNYLNTHFNTQEEKGRFVLDRLTNTPK